MCVYFVHKDVHDVKAISAPYVTRWGGKGLSGDRGLTVGEIALAGLQEDEAEAEPGPHHQLVVVCLQQVDEARLSARPCCSHTGGWLTEWRRKQRAGLLDSDPQTQGQRWGQRGVGNLMAVHQSSDWSISSTAPLIQFHSSMYPRRPRNKLWWRHRSGGGWWGPGDTEQPPGGRYLQLSAFTFYFMENIVEY